MPYYNQIELDRQIQRSQHEPCARQRAPPPGRQQVAAPRGVSLARFLAVC